jgi:hypothetical protein
MMKGGSMLFIGMDGIVGLVATGMEKQFGFMGM